MVKALACSFSAPQPAEDGQQRVGGQAAEGAGAPSGPLPQPLQRPRERACLRMDRLLGLASGLRARKWSQAVTDKLGHLPVQGGLSFSTPSGAASGW